VLGRVPSPNNIRPKDEREPAPHATAETIGHSACATTQTAGLSVESAWCEARPALSYSRR
jgi:hypothetical protein